MWRVEFYKPTISWQRLFAFDCDAFMHAVALAKGYSRPTRIVRVPAKEIES
jgi:hypothetical protein